MTFNAWQLPGVKDMDKPEDYKVDPRSIHVDQRKKDSRRDAWDRDIARSMQSNKKVTTYTNATPFVLSFLCLHIGNDE